VTIDWTTLRNDVGPYPPAAYEFVQEGLRHTVETLRDAEPELPDAGRHVSGQELCVGLRDFALKQYGSLARTVLRSWNVRRTEDFGRIVFGLVDAGMLRKTDEDSIEDFQGVYDFDEAFTPLNIA
jgi:uncharacterized repeat protein (TIGR04138 family)